jgi:hypothetical protein
MKIIDFSFVLMYLTIPVLSILLMKAANVSIFKISISSITIISLLIFSYVGILPLYFGWDKYRYAIGVQDKYLVFQIFIFSSISIIGVIFGFIFARTVFGIDISRNTLYIKPLNIIGHVSLIGVSIICLIVLFHYLKKVPEIALFAAITKGPVEAKVARSYMTNAFSGRYHWYSVVLHDLLNVTTYSLFAAALVRKRKIILLLFLFSLIVSFFTASMSIQKAPPIWLLLGLWIGYLLVKRGGKFLLKLL